MKLILHVKMFFLVLSFFIIQITAAAQVQDWPDDEREGIKINYTEANVPAYSLPDPLRLLNGKMVSDQKTWNESRRPEIVKLLEDNQFGRAVGNPEDVSFRVYEKWTPVFDGKAVRSQVVIDFGHGVEADLLIYLPAGKNKPSPLLLNIGFFANSQIVNDPGIKPGMVWNMDKKRVPAGNDSPFPKTEVLPFIERGYGFAAVYYGDFEPDFNGGIKYGVRNRYLKAGQSEFAPDEWGAISAWAWGLSRAMDYFEKDNMIDHRRVVITGVSRLGKTALWTAARDQRFAMAIPSCSGQGGAAISRRSYGETLKLITLSQRYGYQFCANYAKWGDEPDKAPMDAHMLIALMAPRPVLLQTGDTDKWSDPVGEFKAAVAAEPVYELFGKKGLDNDTIPASGKPVLNDMGFYMHRGGHGMYTADGKADWDVYFDFMDMHLKGISEEINYFPSDQAADVNPDTHLKIIFPGKPLLAKTGIIRVYDASDNRLVDTLDMSIPAGPDKPTPSPGADYTSVPYKYVSDNFTNADTKAGTPSGMAESAPDTYQLTIIGRFTDGFHFHPVIIHENSAVIYLHHNLLEYGKTYYVQVDPEVFTVDGRNFKGIAGKEWQFSTKKSTPSIASGTITVSADGIGDFNTVQGAMDFIPDYSDKKIEVFIKNGFYEEIVYFRNKSNITIKGESREGVVIQYENNEVFNPHPINIKTNEVPGTFPSRRAVFAADNSTDIHITNLTIKNTSFGQAEGLLINGKRNIVSRADIIGSGDALQSNGSAYYKECHIIGDGDTILGRGPAFFKDCEINSYGPYMWIRNTSASHGNVFVNCVFKTRGEGSTVIARCPTNGIKNYPYTEAVLIDCKLSGIDPAGWGRIDGDVTNMRYWEYNSRHLDGVTPVDTAKRHPASQQLTIEKDAGIIANYRNPAYVLGGWTPEID